MLANVEAREEPRQSLQDGDKALETLRASRLDIRRATTARITDLNGRFFTDEPCARHTLQLIPQGFSLALVDFSAGRRGPERATSSLAELTT